MMDRQIKRDWAAALRSDRFTQARHEFTEVVPVGHVGPGGEEVEEVRHCCLAVLTDLACEAGAPHIRRAEGRPGVYEYEIWNEDDDGNPVWTDEWEVHDDGDLPLQVEHWAGLSSANPLILGITAIERNDGRDAAQHLDAVEPQSYAQIADAIERDDSL
jgi:hypothetical protein